ncbi:hypothetical protein [Vreelandella aquamarina]|jgi:hypothetical protein|uniref:Uncharacterized protein n=1 Tax=Vreelandella aquamarina TaxID=77097 RepID=A0A857GSC6_9GAMM|nr:hypothetical protein [Halomonas meridiana]QHD50021.1 hypothetical protein CTT34_10130 [Halomonas meridiana]
MTPNENHPFTGQPNMRYLTVVIAVKDGCPDKAIRQAVEALPLFESLEGAPDCEVTALSCGDALSELESRS